MMSPPRGRTREDYIDLTEDLHDDHMDVDDVNDTFIDLTDGVDKDGVELDVQHYGKL